MYDSVILTRLLCLMQLDVELIILVMFVAAQVHVLEIVQMIVVAMGNVKRGNVSAIRDLWAQTAVSAPKELSVTKVSDSLHKYLDVVALEVNFFK